MGTTLMPSHWANRIRHWESVGPPLKLNASSVQQMQQLVGTNTSDVLMLGVTRELYRAFDNITAMDRQPEMVEHIWLGDTDTKHVILDNWLSAQLPMDRFSAIIGDGSISMLEYPLNVKTMLSRAMDIMRPGGVFACRIYTRPDAPITRQHLLAVARYADVNLYAFNRMIAACLAAERGAVVPNRAIYDLFQELFPNRDELAANTGWDRTEIDNQFDAYINSKLETSMMTRAELLSMVDARAQGVQLVETHGYDFCENCPILVFTK